MDRIFLYRIDKCSAADYYHNIFQSENIDLLRKVSAHIILFSNILFSEVEFKYTHIFASVLGDILLKFLTGSKNGTKNVR